MTTKWIEFRIKQEGVREFSQALERLAEISQREKGCKLFFAFQAFEDPCHFTVLESWQTKEDLQQHRESSHIEVFRQVCERLAEQKSALPLLCL